MSKHTISRFLGVAALAAVSVLLVTCKKDKLDITPIETVAPAPPDYSNCGQVSFQIDADSALLDPVQSIRFITACACDTATLNIVNVPVGYLVDVWFYQDTSSGFYFNHGLFLDSIVEPTYASILLDDGFGGYQMDVIVDFVPCN